MNLRTVSAEILIKDLKEGISVKLTHLIAVFQNIDLLTQNIVSSVLFYGLLCQGIHPILILPEINLWKIGTVVALHRQAQANKSQAENRTERQPAHAQQIRKIEERGSKTHINPAHFHANRHGRGTDTHRDKQ